MKMGKNGNRIYVSGSVGLRLLCLFSLLLFSQSCVENVKPDISGFIKFYGHEGLDAVSALEILPEGGAVFVGSSDSKDTIQAVERQMYVVKTDVDGFIVNESYLGGTHTTEGRAVKILSDGYLFLGDVVGEDKTSDIYLVKTDPLLNTVWEISIGIAEVSERGFALAVLSSGNYFILGTTLTTDGSTEMLTALVNPSGQLLKNPSRPGLQFKNDNVGRSVVVRSGDRVAWCGTQYRDHANTEPGTSNIRLVLSTQDGISDGGDFDFGGRKNDFAGDIQKTHGGFILVGSSEGINGEGTKIFLVATDERGKEQWSRTVVNTNSRSLTLAGNQSGNSILPTRDGGFLIVGSTDQRQYPDQDGQNIFIVKTNGVGEVEWEEIYGGRGKDEAVSVKESPDGGFIIAGNFEFNGDPTICLIKTDSKGKVFN